MGMSGRTSGGALGHQATMPSVVVFFLLAYFLGNVGMQLVHFYRGDDGGGIASKGGEWSVGPGKMVRQKGCDTVEDFIEDGGYTLNGTLNPWRQMKRGLPPAKCRVNGHLIERLDPLYNFRRTVALLFSDDVDDKSHIEHWFLGTKVDFNERKRRVYIDVGANQFESSVLWFQERYPCDFTEVHAFEVQSNLFRIPEGWEEQGNAVTGRGYRKIQTRDGDLPNWMVDRIRPYQKSVGDVDDEERNQVNLTRFIKEELKLTEEDAVIVKMDIEGAEWPILKRWVKDPELPKIIDELWVEVHFYNSDNGFDVMLGTTRDEATQILGELRFKGFYTHYWD